MWTCPKCQAEIDDKLDSCSKCAGTPPVPPPPPPLPPKAKKPFEQYEHLCLLIAILPGVIFFSRGRAQNPEQATFRIAAIAISIILGVGGYAAIKIYQRHKAKDRN